LNKNLLAHSGRAAIPPEKDPCDHGLPIQNFNVETFKIAAALIK